MAHYFGTYPKYFDTVLSSEKRHHHNAADLYSANSTQRHALRIIPNGKPIPSADSRYSLRLDLSLPELDGSIECTAPLRTYAAPKSINDNQCWRSTYEEIPEDKGEGLLRKDTNGFIQWRAGSLSPSQ